MNAIFSCAFVAVVGVRGGCLEWAGGGWRIPSRRCCCLSCCRLVYEEEHRGRKILWSEIGEEMNKSAGSPNKFYWVKSPRKYGRRNFQMNNKKSAGFSISPIAFSWTFYPIKFVRRASRLIHFLADFWPQDLSSTAFFFIKPTDNTTSNDQYHGAPPPLRANESPSRPANHTSL